MSLAIGELVLYFNDLAEFNQVAGQKMYEAINSQFKEVRHVNTGVNLEIESMDEDSIRASISREASNALKRTESKMFGTST